MIGDKTPGWLRILGIVAALGLVGWGAWEKWTNSGAGPVERALRQNDPSFGEAVTHLAEGPNFIDSDGSQRRRTRLWCGRVDGRVDGRVAVLMRHSRKWTGVSVEEVASGETALTDRARWLLSKCEGVRP